MRCTLALAITALVAACGGTAADDDVTGDGGSAGVDAPAVTGDGGVVVTDDDLSTADGCPGVFNPDQIVDLHLTMGPGDWDAVRTDTTYSDYRQAELRCNDEPSMTVAVRRKRSGGDVKVGLKVDINQIVAGQRFYGLRKLSLENGVSEGGIDVSAGDLIAEYLAWRIMVLSGTISGRAAFVRVHVNGDLLGVYVNVEQVDKRFLTSRFGDNNGWLYKKSGGVRDGYKTNETLPNPYADYFCFWANNGCPAPSDADLASELPVRLDVDQFLRMGAVNALIGNGDSPLLKDNNYYFYDWAGGGRAYIPWDLDTVMKREYNVFDGTVPGGTTMYTDVLFSNWEARYDELLTQMLDGPLSLAVIEAEIDRVDAVAASAIDADPYVSGGVGGATDELRTWWSARHPAVAAQLDAH